jgi:hypothetical protein
MTLKNIISYIGLKNLTEKEQSLIKEILNREYPKISRITHNITNIIIHAKTYKNKKAKKYSLHLKVDTPSEFFTAHAADWDLARAIHKTINKVSKEMNSKIGLEKTRANEGKLKRFVTSIRKLIWK